MVFEACRGADVEDGVTAKVVGHLTTGTLTLLLAGAVVVGPGADEVGSMEVDEEWDAKGRLVPQLARTLAATIAAPTPTFGHRRIRPLSSFDPGRMTSQSPQRQVVTTRCCRDPGWPARPAPTYPPDEITRFGLGVAPPGTPDPALGLPSPLRSSRPGPKHFPVGQHETFHRSKHAVVPS